jgi:hypothetical protein
MEITNKTEGYEIIDDIYKIYKVHNVKECTSGWTPEKWILQLHDTKYDSGDTSILHYLFILEPHCDAVGHWVYEAAIYLNLFKKMKILYPSLKLAILRKRMIKTLFFNHFSIPDHDICIFDTSPAPQYSNLPYNNICIFPSPISHHHLKEVVDQLISDQIKVFINCFNSINIPNIEDGSWLLMPRQKKESFQRFDPIPYDAIFRFFESFTYTYSILHTDDILSLNEQIEKLRSATNIVVCDGSAFMFNLLLCRNKTFFVIGDFFTIQQRKSQPVFKLVIDLLIEINQHKVFHTHDQHDFIHRFLPK